MDGETGTRYDMGMKTTIELPDELHRRLKARTAMEGTTISGLARSLFADYIDKPVKTPLPKGPAAQWTKKDLSKSSQSKGKMGR